MERCLVCKNEYKNIQTLKTHLKKQHGMTYIDYKKKFDLYPRCE
ncbi:MAG: MucR family transcriptional regulator [Halanaerobiales bacterium]